MFFFEYWKLFMLLQKMQNVVVVYDIMNLRSKYYRFIGFLFYLLFCFLEFFKF